MVMMQCVGWWEQDFMGRQWMENLTISIEDDCFAGAGVDIVGEFTLSGRFCKEQVAIIKQYLGKHVVEYLGTTDGEGTMSGVWQIGGLVGGKWSIRFVAPASGSVESATEEIAELLPGDQT